MRKEAEGKKKEAEELKMRKAEAALAVAREAASASSRATAAAAVAKTAVEVSEKKEASDNKRRKTTKGPPGVAYAVAPGTATAAVTPVKLDGSRPPMPDESLSAATVLHNAGKIQKSTLKKSWRVFAKSGDRVDKTFPWGDSPINAFNKACAWIEDQNR
jgi:hypothetical protein